MRKLFVILTMLAALLLASVTAFAAPSLVDNAKLLNSAQKREVLAELEKQEQTHHVRMAVVTMGTIGTIEPGVFANKLLDTTYNDGEKGNMVLVHVLDKRQWYIATDAKMKEVVVGNEGTEYMSKPMVAKLKEKDNAGAYIVYAQKGGELLAYYEKEGEGWNPNAGFSWMALAAAMLVSGGVVFLVRNMLVASMSNVRAQVAANAYLDQSSFQLAVSDDNYLYTNVSSVPKAKKNSSSSDGSASDGNSDEKHGGGGGGY